MSYKPDESVLISWLYGELDETEKAKVEGYFQENPDELEKMRQFGDVKDIMATVRDKEVIAPPVMENEATVIPLWRTSSFRTVATIAASFLLIMIAARLLDLNVSYSNKELRIAFGKKEGTTNSSLTASQVQQMIDQSRIELAEASARQIDEHIRQASTASKDDIRNFVSTLQRDNLAQIQDYLQLSSSDQRKYTDNLVVEFSKYLQEQRSQDLNMFQARFGKLEQNTDELKSETEQILASIISSSPQVQQSSY